MLTVLDVNVWANGASAGGSQFGVNVAQWLAAAPDLGSPVPEPASLALFGIGFGLTGIAAKRRRARNAMGINA